MRFPANVPARIETQVGNGTRQKRVRGCTLREHGYPFVFEITESPDVRPPEYFEAADVDATKQHNGVPRVDSAHIHAREFHHHVRAASSHHSGARAVGRLDI